MPSHVLVFGMTDKRGGVESFIMNATGAIDTKKVKFDYIVNTDTVAYEEELKNRGASIIHFPMRAKHPLKFRQQAASFFRENADKYDAIWVNVCSLSNVDYLVFAKKYGIKTRVIHCHNSQSTDSRLRDMLHEINKRRIQSYATDYWTCADSASDWFYGANIRSSSHYKVVPNVIDPKKYSYDFKKRNKFRQLLGYADEDILIGNVGRLHPQKNQRFLIDSFEVLRRNNQNVKLAIAGQGDLRESLENYIRLKNLDGSVKLLGEITDTNDFYQAMDVFAFPSLYEGFSIALLEAQANGVPAVISEGNPSEAVINDNVRRMALDSPEAWAAALECQIGRRIDASSNKIPGSKFDITVQGNDLESFFKHASTGK